jgi:hypothetical protein
MPTGTLKWLSEEKRDGFIVPTAEGRTSSCTAARFVPASAASGRGRGCSSSCARAGKAWRQRTSSSLGRRARWTGQTPFETADSVRASDESCSRPRPTRDGGTDVQRDAAAATDGVSFESRCRIVELILEGASPQAAAAASGASRATGYRLWGRFRTEAGRHGAATARLLAVAAPEPRPALPLRACAAGRAGTA